MSVSLFEVGFPFWFQPKKRYSPTPPAKKTRHVEEWSEGFARLWDPFQLLEFADFHLLK